MAMENIADWKARQSNDRSTTSTALSRQLSTAETIRLDTMIAKTLVYYPNQALSPETLREYRAVFKEIAIRHGVDRLETGLHEMRLTSRYFPHPADVNEAIKERIAIEDASESAAERRVAATHEMLSTRFQSEDGYVTMEEIYRDYHERKRAKAEAAEKEKSAGPQPALPDGKTKGASA